MWDRSNYSKSSHRYHIYCRTSRHFIKTNTALDQHFYLRVFLSVTCAYQPLSQNNCSYTIEVSVTTNNTTKCSNINFFNKYQPISVSACPAADHISGIIHNQMTHLDITTVWRVKGTMTRGYKAPCQVRWYPALIKCCMMHSNETVKAFSQIETIPFTLIMFKLFTDSCSHQCQL